MLMTYYHYLIQCFNNAKARLAQASYKTKPGSLNRLGDFFSFHFVVLKLIALVRLSLLALLP